MQQHASIKPTYVAVAALALGVVTDIFFREMPWGIVVPIFSLVFFSVVAWLARASGHRLLPFELGLIGSAMVLSVFYALRDSEMLFAVNFLLIVYLSLLLFVHLYGTDTKRFQPWDYFVFPVFDLFLATVGSVSIFSHLRPGGSKLGRVGLAVGVGGILLLIFGAFFAAADLVFREMISRTFQWEWFGLEDVVVIACIGVFFTLLFAPAFWRRATMRDLPAVHVNKDVGLEALIVTGLIDVLFGVFMLVQAVYLFRGETNLEQFNITYAEYAREGYFQLLAVAVLVSVVVWALRYFSFGRWTAAVKALQGLLIALTGGVLASSWMRLSLYEMRFGFTHDRLFAHYSLLVIGFVLLLLLAGLVVRLAHGTILRGTLAGIVVAVVGLNVLNPDAFIAKRNIARGLEGHSVDLKYLSTMLSEDATPILLAYTETPEFQRGLEDYKLLLSLEEEAEALRDSIRERKLKSRDPEYQEIQKQIDALHIQANRLWEEGAYRSFFSWVNNWTYDNRWQAWNLSRAQAKELREAYQASSAP